MQALCPCVANGETGMDFSNEVATGALVYIAFGLGIAAFIMRDELWLRLLMLTASGFYICYYYLVNEAPLWDAIITNSLLAAVNFVMICIVLTERSRIFMSREMTSVFGFFPRLTPGQFRRLMRAARMVTADEALDIATEGQSLDRLYFILDGGVTVEKHGHRVALPAGIFIGEVAYLTKQFASASVRLASGSRYLVWNSGDLERLTTRFPALGNALLAHLNIDMAAKVANSHPIEP